MIYVLYWSICWLLSLATVAKHAGRVTPGAILMAALFGPVTWLCVLADKVEWDEPIWRKK